MKKSGLADSPFFSPTQNISGITTPPLSISPDDKKAGKNRRIKKQKPVQENHRDTMTPRYQDSVVSRCHDTIIETVRKAVKEFGKEAATHRFTLEEKKAVAGIIYSYKNSGIKTSENEIARISVDFIVEDYKENGENSILHKILKVLNE